MLIDLSRVKVSGPLSGLAAGFTEHLIQRGYKPKPARRQIYRNTGKTRGTLI